MRLFELKTKSLAWQVLKSTLSIYFLITVTVTLAQMGIEYFEMRDQVQSRLQNVERIYHPALSSALWEMDAQQVSALQEKILALSFISAIRIVDEQGQESFKSKHTISPSPTTVTHTFDLYYQVSNVNAHLATVTLLATYDVVLDLLKVSYQLIMINALIKSIALTFLFIWVFQKSLSEPLRTLISRIATINLTTLENARVDLGQPQENELSELERSFNSMLTVLANERKQHAARLEEVNRDLEKQVAIRTEELARANQQLLALVREDPLTGIANRRYFFEQANTEMQRAFRSGALSLLMIDLDHFKRVNDTWGHAVGDAVLKNFSVVAREPLRVADLMARIGGEEFAVLLPATTAEGARVVAERIREVVLNQFIEITEGQITYTVSIGVTEMNAVGDSLSSFMKRADTALYRAKELGRNRIEVLKNESASFPA